MSPSSSHLVIIPSFNTGPKVLEVVRDACAVWNPVWVVVDGSNDGTPGKLQALEEELPGLRVFVLPKNRGKGAAVFEGITHAQEAGFSHVLTLDADGQHPVFMIPRYMNLSQHRPGSLVLGNPIFGDDAPVARVLGRKLSNFWAHVETLWAGIGDSLFGMRVYPINDLIAVMQDHRWARRFDFDPEVAIRLCWRGVTPVNIDTPVRYLTPQEGGVSHFNYLRDNTLLTWMHWRLLIQSPLHWPILWQHHRGRKASPPGSPQNV
ncbi:MAG: glycosyltransferase family 2 protein [Verrucomicrobiota bacterium]